GELGGGGAPVGIRSPRRASGTPRTPPAAAGAGGVRGVGHSPHAAPRTGHPSARSTTDWSALWTGSDVRTVSRTPAKATAARVPTAYSAVFIPASGRDRTQR